MDHVPEREFLERVRRHAVQGALILGRHAQQRMIERNIMAEDVNNAAFTATTAKFQRDKGTWRLEGGLDLDGEVVVLVVAPRDDGTFVVTVM
jgi:hypothetical protein